MALKYINPVDIKVGDVVSYRNFDRKVVKRKRYAAKGVLFNRLTLEDGTLLTARDHARLAVVQ